MAFLLLPPGWWCFLYIYLVKGSSAVAREAYLNLCMPLYKVAMKVDWDATKGIVNINQALLTATGAKNNIQIVGELVKMMDEEDLALHDIKGNTALSFAAAAGIVEIAEILIRKNRFLPTIPSGEGMTPLYMAILCLDSLKWHCIYTLKHLAMKLLQDDRTLARARKGDNKTALHVLARKCSEFSDQSTSGMGNRLMKTCVKGPYKRNLKQTQALKLVECLWKEMLKCDDDEVMRLIREPSELLFDVAKIGYYEFLSVLIDSYPELLLEYDDNNLTIFHIAVFHRHASLFNLAHETGSIKDIIETFTDDENNNILHLAEKLEVEKIVQSPFIHMKYKQGKTLRELFTSEHEDLLHKGELWMKDTANPCMLISTIIATVVFSAAFSIPGETFLIFAISDGVVHFSFSTTIPMCLCILTSQYAENDFLKSLLLKLMIGLTSLFVSITSMMIVHNLLFILSLWIKMVPDLIFIFAFVLVVLFAFLQYPLLSDILFSTYWSSLLFQPRRDMI
ncbi:ankyrin repeat-containing protein [Pyrus ussuriensis x Pyrus communis]|uniref:Ankyrin repeat-containing protein n=1 Tax=Pyrus ussuriensis x Pyrus communis TaxID=2448454 RepID=A0A5N5GHT0_9ROSA|nr:ankyrin repeat-containing protein [Pyrus ussuriensis x Pyrus communis]